MSSKLDAFTLVEMLIVMAIIGLLSIGAIAGGSYAIRQGRVSRKIKNVDQLGGLLQAYYNERLVYPEGNANYSLESVLKSGGTGSDLLSKYGEGFIFDGEPCKGGADVCYRYGTFSSNPSKFALCVGLEDTKKGNVFITEGGYILPVEPELSFSDDKADVKETVSYSCYCIGGESNANYKKVCAMTSVK